MKRALAFIISLTVIWLQVRASAQTISPPAPELSCPCCVAKKSCCCVTETAPEAIPLPAAPVSAGAAVDFTAVIPQRLAWTLPATAPAIVSSADRSLSSLTVPLFTRHCALLI